MAPLLLSEKSAFRINSAMTQGSMTRTGQYNGDGKCLEFTNRHLENSQAKKNAVAIINLQNNLFTEQCVKVCSSTKLVTIPPFCSKNFPVALHSRGHLQGLQ
jgi:hypothetical protein